MCTIWYTWQFEKIVLILYKIQFKFSFVWKYDV